MFEELNKLFESEVLNDETKTAISEAFEAKLTEARAEIQKEEEAKAAKKLVENNGKLYSTVEELVKEEFKELKEDVHQAKKDNIKNAKKIEMFKEDYKAELNKSVMETIQSLVEGEMSELKVDLQRAKRNDVGMQVMETFGRIYQEQFAKEDMKKLTESLTAAEEKTRTLSEQIEKRERADKIDSLLENLTGSQKAAMQNVLEGTATDKLETRFEEALPIITESDDGNDDTDDKQKELAEQEKINKGKIVKESDEENAAKEKREKEIAEMRRFAGIRQ